MKRLTNVLPISIVSSLLLVLLAGCYTQLATTRDEERPRRYYTYGDDRVEQEDTIATEERGYRDDYDPYYDSWRTRSHFMFRFYYPAVYSYWAYDPWFTDCFYFYDPWICGTPFIGYPYWYSYRYRPFYSGYYSPYRFYRNPYYWGEVVYVPGSGVASRTRNSGVRRTGEDGGAVRDGSGRYTSGSSGSFGMPASRTSGGSRGEVSGRSATRTRSGEQSGYDRGSRGGEVSGRTRGTSSHRGSYTPPASRSGESGRSSSPAPSRRGSGGGESRGSGSTRSRDNSMPASSYTPPAQPSPSSAPAVSAPSSGSGSGGSRSSGATRSRDH